MRWFTGLILLACFTVPVHAHYPDWKNMRVLPTFDLIGPLGSRLPASHRRKYNRPTYWGGKIAYLIAPSSQEAMVWHDMSHRDAYKKHRPRIEKHFFYPKPWESLKMGARTPTVADNKNDLYTPPATNVLNPDADPLASPTLAEPLASEPIDISPPEVNPAEVNPVEVNPAE